MSLSPSRVLTSPAWCVTRFINTLEAAPVHSSPVPPHRVRFEAFEVDLKAGELSTEGLKVRLQEKPFQILRLLLEQPGEVLTREEIQRRLWSQDTFVDFEHCINSAVMRLREALGDSAEHPRFIETVGRRGYRFIASVELVAPEFPPATVAPASSPAGPGGSPAWPREGRAYKRVAIVAGGVFALLAVLLAFNVAGLRDRARMAVRSSFSRPMPESKIQSIAVLPLENLSGEREQEYFADGMTEELITYLGKVGALRVISRTSVMQYKSAKKPLPQIARELNVDALVEGAVLRSGNRVRITVQLVQANPEKHLWANSYERDLQDVLVLQSEVARAVVSEIQINLTPEDRTRFTVTRPIDPEAYEAFVKGRHFWDIWTPVAQLKCVQYYEQAIQKEPAYALAYAHVAHCYDMLAFMEYPPAREYQEKAHAAAQRALELDGQLAEAHMIFADQKYWVNWDWSAGEAAFHRAMELNPASVDVVSHYGYALEVQGRIGEAIRVWQRALQLDPLSPTVNGFLARAFFNAHQEQRAIEQYRKMLDFEPKDARAYSGLGSVHEAAGRNDEAVSAYLKAASLVGESAQRLEAFQSAYRAGGIRGYWKKRLDYLRERAKREHVSPLDFASFYAHAGEKKPALGWLEKAYEQHTPALVWLKAERTWDPLRSDPRFQDLLRHMNFPP